MKVEDKETILGLAGEKLLVTLKGPPRRLKTDYGMVWQKQGKPNIFKVLKEKSCQPRIFYPEKLSFRNEVQIKNLPKKLRDSISGKSISKFFQKEILHYFFKQKAGEFRW